MYSINCEGLVETGEMTIDISGEGAGKSGTRNGNKAQNQITAYIRSVLLGMGEEIGKAPGIKLLHKAPARDINIVAYNGITLNIGGIEVRFYKKSRLYYSNDFIGINKKVPDGLLYVPHLNKFLLIEVGFMMADANAIERQPGKALVYQADRVPCLFIVGVGNEKSLKYLWDFDVANSVYTYGKFITRDYHNSITNSVLEFING